MTFYGSFSLSSEDHKIVRQPSVLWLEPRDDRNVVIVVKQPSHKEEWRALAGYGDPVAFFEDSLTCAWPHMRFQFASAAELVQFRRVLRVRAFASLTSTF